MANFFNEIAGGAEKMQAQFLGPTYNYAKNIASPNDMEMSGDGSTLIFLDQRLAYSGVEFEIWRDNTVNNQFELEKSYTITNNDQSTYHFSFSTFSINYNGKVFAAASKGISFRK